MNSKSPPKPWESMTSATNDLPISSIDSGINNDVLPSQAPLPKNLNNPHINRSGPTQPQTQLTPNNNTNTTSNSTTTDQSQNNNNNNQYSSQYQISPYNDNSLYGNSMYSPYGSMYGSGYNSMYGGYGMGMNGMNGMGMGMYPGMQGGIMGSMNIMQNSVNHVGRFSQLLQMGSQALHMSFSSIVQFTGNVAMLVREFGGFFTGIYLFRYIKYLFKKIKRLLMWLIGKKPSMNEQFEDVFDAAVTTTNNNNNNQSSNGNNSNNSQNKHRTNWLSVGFYIFGLLWLCQWIWKTVRHEINAKNNPNNPNVNNPMGMNPQMYGGYGQYGNSMYNPMAGAYGQYGMGVNPYQSNPALTYPQNQNQNQNQNNSNNNDGSTNENNQNNNNNNNNNSSTQNSNGNNFNDVTTSNSSNNNVLSASNVSG